MSIPFTIIPVFDTFSLILCLVCNSSIFSSISVFGFVFLYSSNIFDNTFVAVIEPNPTAAYISSIVLNEYFCNVDSMFLLVNSSSEFNLIRFNSRAIISFPRSIFKSLSFFLNHCWIFVLADELFTNFNQSLLGPLLLSFVIISTISPLCNGVIIGIILLFILAPTILFPMSACIEYAKSIGVDPFGNVFICPFGVKTYTESSTNSVFNVDMNSSGFCMSFCHSKLSLSHASLSSFTVTFSFLPCRKLCSLYAQCAAIPNSAILCILYVLICTSNGVPFGPNNVVCSD